MVSPLPPKADMSSASSDRLRSFWHADCLIAGMADENYLLLLLQIVCLLMFSCGVVVLTQHPEWFGA
jgi:hypothetical protein